MLSKSLFFGKLFILFFVIIFYCEYAHHNIVLSRCDWPQLNQKKSNKSHIKPVKFMVLTDTHIMGSLSTVWIDRILRDWEMHRSFQTAIKLHKPEIVFVLGDLTDEGEFSTVEQFEEFKQRFYRLFALPKEIKMYITIGNHDMGYHYSTCPYAIDRFVQAFHSNNTQLIEVRGIYFVLVNSILLEGDNCFLCKPVENELLKLEKIFDCYSNETHCSPQIERKKYSKPILMQHFPLYRESDKFCSEPDEAPLSEKMEIFTEKWDCLGKKESLKLIKQIKPRLVVSGHTHHGCTRQLPSNGGIEITLPSFNWRNKINPSYGLFVATPDEYAFYKCLMPVETTVYGIYIIGFIFGPLWLFYCHSKYFRNKVNHVLLKIVTSR